MIFEHQLLIMQVDARQPGLFAPYVPQCYMQAMQRCRQIMNDVIQEVFGLLLGLSGSFFRGVKLLKYSAVVPRDQDLSHDDQGEHECEATE